MRQRKPSGGLFGALERLGRTFEDPNFRAGLERLRVQLDAKIEADRRLERDARAAGVPERERKLLMHRNGPEQARAKIKATTQRHRGAHFRAALALTRPARRPQPRPRARRPGARRAAGIRSGQDPGDDGESEPAHDLVRRLSIGLPA